MEARQHSKTLKRNIFIRIFNFYYEGFRTMTWGKKLWVIILIKLFIIFVILKFIFFPDYLESNFNTDQERSNHVIEELTNR